jgi:predicted pyridoxine 5'-phosphate oxidase superfamily flavin-nucleotide-binding protein
MEQFGTIAFTPSVRSHQQRRGSLDSYDGLRAMSPPTELGPDEIEFLTERDSFYLASVGEGGWPYVQHRGGPRGFLRVLDGRRLAWIERSGNRQFVSAGNLDHDDRVSIIAVDYPNRRRLKLLGRARWQPEVDPDVLAAFDVTSRVEALVTVEIVAFEWNCPKFITPRFTVDEVRMAVDHATAALQRRIAELESRPISPMSDVSTSDVRGDPRSSTAG